MEEISTVYHSDWFHVLFLCVQAFITGAYQWQSLRYINNCYSNILTCFQSHKTQVYQIEDIAKAN